MDSGHTGQKPTALKAGELFWGRTTCDMLESTPTCWAAISSQWLFLYSLTTEARRSVPEVKYDLQVHALYLANLQDSTLKEEAAKNAFSDLRSIFFLNLMIGCFLALGRELGTNRLRYFLVAAPDTLTDSFLNRNCWWPHNVPLLQLPTKAGYVQRNQHPSPRL